MKQETEAGRRIPQGTGDKDEISRFCRGTAQGFSRYSFSQQRKGEKKRTGSAYRISSHQCNMIAIGTFVQSLIDVLYFTHLPGRRNSQRQKGKSWSGTHRRNIAQIGSQQLPADV